MPSGIQEFPGGKGISARSEDSRPPANAVKYIKILESLLGVQLFSCPLAEKDDNYLRNRFMITKKKGK